MTTRREIVKAGAGLAAILAAGNAPAALVRSLVAARNTMTAGKRLPDYWGLTFVAKESGATITMATFGTPPSVSLETSTDGKTWEPFIVGTTLITLAHIGDYVFFRAGGAGTNTAFASDLSNYNYFAINGRVAASGDISSLLDNANTVTSLEGRPYAFACLFQWCTTLVSTPVLPASTLSNGCYYEMFYRCEMLTSAPTLPATVLAEDCYDLMFYWCISLKAPPVLRATALERRCYYAMFFGCSSLTVAPALPASILATECYKYMFGYCDSLSTPPTILAETMADYSCEYMFQNCTSLAIAPALPAENLAMNCYAEMFSGCTSLAVAPVLPATTVKRACYKGMFRGCTSLVVAPELLSKTLIIQCYAQMFDNCSALASIKVHFETWSRQMTANWVIGVPSSGRFICPVALSHSEVDYSESKIPPGWTVETF